MMRAGVILLLLFLQSIAFAQTTCVTQGQNPSTAFPVCGTGTFQQTSVPLCGGRAMPFRGCGANSGLTDRNPFWYKFTCFQSGTLGFLITPSNLNEDYDWELYDITNRSPDEVYADANLVITNNWSGENGLTGASAAGTEIFVCGGGGKPLFSKMPSLTAGRNYLLLISHWTNSQSGYKLSFGGGTAVITDPTEPHLQKVEANCGGTMLRLKLSKKIKCNSITATASEFYITPAAGNITGAAGFNCSSQFDTDSILLQLSSGLAAGNYVLRIKNGTDNNTLLDLCDRSIPSTDSLPFTVLPQAPTPMDSLIPVSCAPNFLKLVFKKAINCNSIDANGSDFTVNGTYPVAVTAAAGTCNSGFTKEIIVTLSSTLQRAGSFQIILNQGSDGNTLIDECTEETPAGSSLSFSVSDTVDANFTYNINYGCEKDTVLFFQPGGNSVNQWNWNLDEGQQSLLQNPTAFYSVFNTKRIVLSVSNGICRDSSETTITLDNFLKAEFSAFEDNCPNEPVLFTGTAKGKIVQHTWSFGDGSVGNGTSPTHIYGTPLQQTEYIVSYTVIDSFGCSNTAQQKILIYPSCYLAVPTAFTPNNDGKNDMFGVTNAIKADNLEMVIFNRWGQLVFKTNNWKNEWDGRVNSILQPTGVFVWFLRYTDRTSKKRIEQKGTVTLIR